MKNSTVSTELEKLILGVCLVFVMVFGAVATGDTPSNSDQTGSTTLTTFTGNTWTNVFPIPYTVTPIVQLFPTSTNGAPFSLTYVTPSNFAFASTANTPTNCTVLWRATLPITRIQTGTNTVVAATPLVVTFPVPYAYPPVVFAAFSTTNLNAIIAINPQSTTTTNFTILENLGGIASWFSIGSVFIPGATTVTY